MLAVLLAGCEQTHTHTDSHQDPDDFKPRVSLSANPTSGDSPLTVTFTFSATPASGNVIEVMTLRVGNGESYNVRGKSSATYTYVNNNWFFSQDFTATLHVEDDAGFHNSASVTINVD
jgi:PKD repeat protein